LGAGASLIAVFAFNLSIVQLLVSDTMRGRVMSVYNAAFRGGMPLGSLLSGFLIRQSSAPVVMAANGLAMMILAIGFLTLQRDLAKL